MVNNKYIWLIVVSTILLIAIVNGEEEEVVDKEKQAFEARKLGDQSLRAKLFDSAISHYKRAIDLEPDNYQNSYKRASAYIIKNRMRSALRDLNKVVSLKPDYIQGLLRRGKVHIALGNFKAAETDLKKVKSLDPTNTVTGSELQKVAQGKNLQEQASSLMKSSQWMEAKIAYTQLIKLSPESEFFLVERAKCNKNLGDNDRVLEDTIAALKVNGNNLEALLLRGLALCKLGDTETAIKYYRQGLRYNPDYKPIKTEYKKLKKFIKSYAKAKEFFEGNAWEAAFDMFDSAITAYPEFVEAPFLFERQCKCQLELKQAQKAIEYCDKALAASGTGLYEATLWKGDAYMHLDDFDSALRFYQQARQINQHDNRAIQGMQNAERQRKIQNRKDYYKILEVEKSANIKQIRKAFRTKAMVLHPDKAPSDKKEEYEKAYLDLNEAYEVLSNAEKRGRYDRGEDLDAQPQQQHHHNPFGAGGPFTFHFNMG